MIERRNVLMRFMNYENPFFRFVGGLVDHMLLNLLTVALCIPVVTGGAALSAMYYCSLRYIRGEEGYLLKMFFTQFKKNFKPATVIWLAEVLFGFLVYLDFRILRQAAENGGMAGAARPMMYLVMAFALFGLFIMQYLLPLVSRYESSLRDYFKNAVLLSVSYFPRTVLMAVIHAAVIVTFIMFWIYALPVYAVLGLSGPGWLVMKILDPVFRKIEERSGEGEAETSEDTEN